MKVFEIQVTVSDKVTILLDFQETYASEHNMNILFLCISTGSVKLVLSFILS